MPAGLWGLINVLHIDRRFFKIAINLLESIAQKVYKKMAIVTQNSLLWEKKLLI